MELRELHYISTIGRTRHMTTAAQELFISQTALYKSLRKIEAELDTTLFFRKGNELIPTDTGEIVLEKSEHILSLMSELKETVAATKNLKRGKVTIGFPSVVGTMFLPNMLLEFQKKYPEISLRTVEAGGNALSGMVISGEIDMAIIMRPVYSDLLNEIPLIKDQVAAGINSDHPFAARKYITIRDLKDIPFVTFDQTFNMRAQLSNKFEAENIPLKTAFDGASCQFLYEVSALSNNILVLPRPIINYYSQNTMVTIPFKPSFSWELALIFQKNSFLSNASRALINHIQEGFFNLLV